MATDEQVITEGLRRAEDSETGLIDDFTARVIAASWHSGQDSALYALASTGAILDRTAYIIRREIANNPYPELYALASYVRFHGERGPVTAWIERCPVYPENW